MNEDTGKYHSKNVVWAIFLIFIGTIFLLNTTSVLSWGIWTYILRFWPIFLILGGLKLIIGQSLIADIVLSISALILFLAVGVMSYSTYTQSKISFLPNSVNECMMEGCIGFRRMGDIDKQMVVSESDFTDEISSRELDINIGAAAFELIDEDISNYLTVRAQYPSRYVVPELESSLEQGVLEINFESARLTGIAPFSNQESSYYFILGNRNLITDLNIVLGAGEGKVDLDSTIVDNIFAQAGAGKLSLNLDGRSLPNGDIKIQVGAGEVILTLPKNVGYELEYNLGIGTITVDGEEIATFIGEDDNYKSENYESSNIKVKIVADVGVGSLAINSK